jgi:ribosome biogenesis protein Nip4
MALVFGRKNKKGEICRVDYAADSDSVTVEEYAEELEEINPRYSEMKEVEKLETLKEHLISKGFFCEIMEKEKAVEFYTAAIEELERYHEEQTRIFNENHSYLVYGELEDGKLKKVQFGTFESNCVQLILMQPDFDIEELEEEKENKLDPVVNYLNRKGYHAFLTSKEGAVAAFLESE